MTKTTTVKKKPATKVVAKKTVKATKTRVSATKKATVSKSKKAPAKKKGVVHHTKRLYHATPKFVHGMIFGALVGLATVGILGASAFHPVATNADSKCDAEGIGAHPKTLSTNNTAYKINGSTTTVTFNVTGQNCHLPVTMVIWKAPNPTDGKPYSAQTVYRRVTGTFGAGLHQLTSSLPGCYFQADTITGTKMYTGNNDLPARMVAYMHGGSNSCNAKPVPPSTPKTPNPPTPPPTTVIIQVCDIITNQVVPIQQQDYDVNEFSNVMTACNNQPQPPLTPTSTPVTPAVTVTPAATTTALPNTGPGAIILVAIMAVVGGVVFHKVYHHRKGTYRKPNHS